LVVFRSLEGTPSLLAYVLELGVQIAELDNLPAITDTESDCCGGLLFSETVLDIVHTKGDEGLVEFLTTLDN
jgi:hypothetical protein